ncbi:phosphoglycerate kinase [PVC group bacterium]|nr:phosphoglycerate kinase [PVC group bacterium]
MGLDQWAGVVIEDENGGIADVEPIAQWRKHPNLHGWMEDLWRSRGLSTTGEWNEFNQVNLELKLQDINRLEWEIQETELPETEGFFFGDNADREYKESDLQFCKEARKLIKEGKRIVYNSWW